MLTTSADVPPEIVSLLLTALDGATDDLSASLAARRPHPSSPARACSTAGAGLTSSPISRTSPKRWCA